MILENRRRMYDLNAILRFNKGIKWDKLLIKDDDRISQQIYNHIKQHFGDFNF